MQVGVYWNLRVGGFSLCAMKSDRTRGPLLAHCRSIDLTGARMIVNENGRLRSVAKHKEVHAWITGALVAFDGTVTPAGAELGLVAAAAGATPAGVAFRYNPHRAPTFTTDDGAPIEQAPRVACRMIGDKPCLTSHA